MAIRKHTNLYSDGYDQESIIFELIAQDIEEQGYSIRPGALPRPITQALYDYQLSMDSGKYIDAGIGRDIDYIHNEFVRTDEICWITNETNAGRLWLDWTSRLQSFLNKRLFLGLFSFESHFAHYSTGDYYKRHSDSFAGDTNRVLSIVTYQNSGWLPSDGGELVLYLDEHDKEGISIRPLYGTVVVFLSEEFPHEVMTTRRERYSVAGWFRINSSTPGKIDPPR